MKRRGRACLAGLNEYIGGGKGGGINTTLSGEATQVVMRPNPNYVLLQTNAATVNLPSVEKCEALILAVLHKADPQLLFAADIASHLNRARTTVAETLRSLESKGLVHRPEGPRKGYRLTQQGRALMEKCR